jgi:hypothetical protein
MEALICRSRSVHRSMVFCALVALLPIGTMLFGQTSQPQSEEERVGEMKTRVIALLGLNSGDTAADMGCGDGFTRFPWPDSSALPGGSMRRTSATGHLLN